MKRTLLDVKKYSHLIYSSVNRLLNVRWIKYPIRAAVLISCTIYLYLNYRSIENYRIDINFLPVSLTLIGSIFMTLMGIVSWRTTLLIINHSSSWREVAEVQLKTNLAKYLPGLGWQLLGKVYLTTNTGVTLGRSGIGLALELALTFFTGIDLAIFLFPDQIFLRFGILPPDPTMKFAVRMICILLFVISPILFSRYLIASINHSKGNNRLVEIYFLFLLMIFGWIINGLCFTILATAFVPVALSLYPYLIFIFISSFVIGFLIFIIPASLGVREGIIAFMLGPIVGGPIAVLIGITYRILVVLSEVLSLLLFTLFCTLKPKPVPEV